jgi:histone-binding protein RBBP4
VSPAEVELPLEDTELDNRNYDDEKQQVGGFGTPHGKIHIKQQINHDGEVNRARWGTRLWCYSAG